MKDLAAMAVKSPQKLKKIADVHKHIEFTDGIDDAAAGGAIDVVGVIV